MLAGGLDDRANQLAQSNLQKFLKRIAYAKIRSIAARIVSATGEEVKKEECRGTDDPIEPAALVHEVLGRAFWLQYASSERRAAACIWMTA